MSLPAEVAQARESLARLLLRLDPDGEHGDEPGDGPGDGNLSARPTVVLAGAPGRGRRCLLAALLGCEPPDPPAGQHLRASAETMPDEAVPLLDELDLVVPARPDPMTWPVDGATAALILADAAAPLGGDELGALCRVADRVDTVVLVLVRVDAHRGWRTVLDADRALVGERVPRLAGVPWFPVATALAARAGTREDAVAVSLRRRSGIADLQRELYRLVARRRRMLGEANALRRAAAALDTVARQAESTGEALRRLDAGPVRARRRDELMAARSALRRSSGEHHTRWRASLAAARVEATDHLAVQLRALSSRARERVEHADRGGLEQLPTQVAAEVERLAERVISDLGARLGTLVTDTLAELLPPDEPALQVRVPPRPVAPEPPGRRGRRAEDRLLVVVGASGGLGLTRLALLPLLAVPAVSVLGPALVPVSVGLGLGAAGWMARTRRLAADRAYVRQWLAEAVAQVRADLDRVLADALIVTEREVTLALDAALAQRAQELDAAVRDAERALRADDADRTAAAREAARTAAEARRGRDRAVELLERIAALRDQDR